MPASRLYLDWNASAPLSAEAAEAMMAVMAKPGNASSVHAEGRFWRAELATARRRIAEAVGAKPDNVQFNSGATEGAATVLTPDWTFGRAPLVFDRLLVGATEHPAVAAGGRFAADQVERLPVKSAGLIDLARLDDMLAGGGRRALVAIQMANSETGVIQPVAQIAAIARAHGATFVCDAVQALGKIPTDLAALDADVLILSAHKVGGPKGAGALVFASDLMRPVALLPGGGQERGLRSGTENVPALAGFGAAAATASPEIWRETSGLRDAFESGLQEIESSVQFHGRDAPRLPNTSYFSIPGRKAETLQIAFDLAGIAVSPGSACSSGKVGRSPVLEAMGIVAPDGAIRVSFGPGHTAVDVDRALDVLRRRS